MHAPLADPGGVLDRGLFMPGSQPSGYDSKTAAFHLGEGVGFPRSEQQSCRTGLSRWTTTITYFEAQLRGLHSRYPQLQTPPYGVGCTKAEMPVGSLLTCRP